MKESEAVVRRYSLWDAIRLFFGVSKCAIFGHKNSGEFYCSTRCWQRCSRCGGWLGWMFHWERQWTDEDARSVLSTENGR
jgi:hypothetical protein